MSRIKNSIVNARAWYDQILIDLNTTLTSFFRVNSKYRFNFQVMECFHNAEKVKRAKPTDMFEDVFDKLPANLERQKKEMLEHIKNYKSEYPLDLYEKDKL